MDYTSKEYIEDEFYIQLCIECTKCEAQFHPSDQAGWISTGNLELDAHKMKDEYADIALGLGWSTNSNGDILCPKCQ